jgi:hypothetical protein
MKRKAIKVEYRKDSDSFPDWLKYEITVLNEDGTKEIIPAYGKDLQDALSRIVHDERVDKIQKGASMIPNLVWIVIFFTYISLLSIYSINIDKPWLIPVGLFGVIIFILSMNGILSSKRNRI